LQLQLQGHIAATENEHRDADRESQHILKSKEIEVKKKSIGTGNKEKIK